MNLKKWMADTGGEGSPPEDQKETQDYLSKLANSILSKEKQKLRPPSASSAPQNPQQMQQRAAGRPNAPMPRARQQAAAQQQRRPQPQAAQQQQQAQTPVPGGPDPRTGWIRKVEMKDSQDRFLPGTILVFEDGSVGVYKEYNPAKDYDIVYQLAETGKAVPQGIPLYNYEIEPVGRVSAMVLDFIITHNRWERDMIVFHLLKYKDIAYVPKIDTGEEAGRSGSRAVRKLSDNQLRQSSERDDRESSGEKRLPEETGAEEKQQEEKGLVRGRRLTIDFGPNRRWEAIYWGEDELGHVVAHNTHDKWSLMHLDLQRFQDSVQHGDIAPGEILEQVERDFASA